MTSGKLSSVKVLTVPNIELSNTYKRNPQIYLFFRDLLTK